MFIVSLMFPIATLPAAALLLRFGQEDMLNIPFLAAAGAGILDNLALIFAIGIAMGLAHDGNGGAVHNIGNSKSDTGIADTMINDCMAPILPSPIIKRITATAPIIIAQKTRNPFEGLALPVMATEIV